VQFGKAYGIRPIGNTPDHLVPSLGSKVFEIERNEGFVLDDQDAQSQVLHPSIAPLATDT
jgi:hypothetical protein